jgi:hypothetical protein
MVAYTPDLCLPYYEGTDSPCLNTGTVCDPSNVWCDLVNLVEGFLDDIDDITARTTNVIPLAQVSYSPPDPAVTVLGEVPWNTVDLDTDDMVDLDFYQGIIPKRSGVYLIDTVLTYAALNTGVEVDAYLTVGNLDLLVGTGITGTVGIAHTIASTTSLVPMVVRTSALVQFTDSSPAPRTVTVNSQFTGSALTQAVLTVSWHSDVS